MTTATKPRVLVIAGHDPSGGAGIHADIEAIHALGGFASTLITALTVQNTIGVQGFQMVSAELLAAQADCLLEDMQFDAVKIGVTGNLAVVELIEKLLPRLGAIPVVLDPVLAAESGGSLAEADLPRVLTRLFPRVTLITPNLIEARALSGKQELEEAGQELVRQGAKAALITGTHDDTPHVQNHLFTATGVTHSQFERLPGSYHGSGCTLASAIACLLAQGKSLEAAVREGQDYTYRTLKNAFRAGKGQWIPRR